jgi:dipeptidyl aminopeptidase/acylaminoacyl peptidase
LISARLLKEPLNAIRRENLHLIFGAQSQLPIVFFNRTTVSLQSAQIGLNVNRVPSNNTLNAAKGENVMSFARRLLPFLLLSLAVPALAGQEGHIIERLIYVCPAWETAVKQTDVEKYSTEGEYVAACDSHYTLEKVRYRSDGLAIIAYLYRPQKSEGTKRPVIIFNRGSYIRGEIFPELLPMFHRLAEAGFAIIAPMYRGSDGGEGRDEMGGADVNDLMNTVPILSKLDFLDTRNVFLYGESRGGMMVFQAIRDGFPARAAATIGAFTDLGEITSSGSGAATAKTIWPDFEQRKNEIISRRSAIRWPERLSIPLLLMHGSADSDVPLTQTLLLATQLAKTQKEFGVFVFPGGNHRLQQHRVERDRQVVEFFRRHLIK